MKQPLRGKAQWLFLSAAIVGCVLPLNYFVRFLSSEGLNLSQFFQQLFQNNVSAFFAMDVFVSAVAFWLLVFTEGRRLKMRGLWVYVICTTVVGVSFALPLFLFFRERQR